MRKKFEKFNCNRYFYLKEKLRKTNFLSEIPEFSKEESFELASYRSMIEDRITYNDQSKYCHVIETFLKGQIDYSDFTEEFLTLRTNNRETFYNLENDLEELRLRVFEYDPETEYFAYMIGTLYEFYDVLLDRLEAGVDVTTARNRFKDQIKELYEIYQERLK